MSSLAIRVHGADTLRTLIYLPGLHGDWTLVSSFREAVAGHVRFVEFVYPSDCALTLEDYGRQIIAALKAEGIRGGWLLGESFGSQVLWELIRQGYAAEGLILAGGFVRFPFLWGLASARHLCGSRATWPLKFMLWVYPRYARFRHRSAPVTLAAIDEFVRRRAAPGDREAMTHRMALIAASDPRPVAAACRVPVYSLSGFWDPIVFWGPVRRWLRASCPAFRQDRPLFWADHTVLATQPDAACRQILEWMSESLPPGNPPH
jgi:pimeloyl-ACP methyl ester carboxylesterase